MREGKKKVKMREIFSVCDQRKVISGFKRGKVEGQISEFDFT